MCNQVARRTFGIENSKRERKKKSLEKHSEKFTVFSNDLLFIVQTYKNKNFSIKHLRLKMKKKVLWFDQRNTFS